MKKSSIKKDSDKNPKKWVSKKATSDSSEERDNPFDFGGLPQRDLKKNLGCG